MRRFGNTRKENCIVYRNKKLKCKVFKGRLMYGRGICKNPTEYT